MSDIKDSNDIQTKTENPTPTALIKVCKVINTERENFQCVMCKEVLPSQSALKSHFLKHAENKIDLKGKPIENNLISKPIPCEFCPEILPNLSKAIYHKYRKHLKQGTNFFCEICGKLFPLKIALEQHEKSEHKIEKATTSTSNDDLDVKIKQEYFHCKFCPVKFVTGNALDFHEKCVHKFEKSLILPIFLPPPSTKIKINNASDIFSVYFCYLCGCEYVLKYNLRTHLEAHHTIEERNRIPNEGLIRCKTCNAIFYTQKAYSNHLYHHKNGDLYVTSEEQRQKVINRVDQDFDVRRVVPRKFDEMFTNPKRFKAEKNLNCTNLAKPIKVEKNQSDSDEMSPPSSVPSSDDE